MTFTNSDIYMDYGGVDKAVQDLDSSFKKIVEALEVLNSDLGRIIEGSWTGAPYTAYRTAQDGWNGAAVSMGDTLNKIQQALDQAKVKMIEADKRGEARF